MALKSPWAVFLAILVMVAFLVSCGGDSTEVPERVVEVPVERIVEKEVTVEVPVDRVVEKEVTVEVPVDRVVEKEVTVEVPGRVVERVVPMEVEVEVPVVKNLVVNNLQQCVDEYDPEADYFPDKTEAQYALEWQVEYFNNYKVITVDTDTGADSENLIQYVLVQCGTPTPTLSGDLADAMMVQVPVQRYWEGGGATFAALDALGALDRVIGVNRRTSGHENHFLPDVVARVTQDDVHEETSYGDDLELILEGEPDVYFQYNGPDWLANALDVGVPAIHYSPFSEGPLGSAEQVKFVSLFFNLEARANSYFQPIKDEYNRVKELAQAQSASPSVLLGTIASSGNFQSRNRTRLESVLIQDAGGMRPLLGAVDQGLLDGTAALGWGGVALEVALEYGQDAEYWFDMAYIPSQRNVPEFLDRNPLNAEFPAMLEGRAFHRYGRAADYHSTGAVRADILLKDIVSIIHPGLLPNHQLVFLDRIETSAEVGIFATNPQGMVDEYTEGVDYFPDKVEVKWAKDWTVSYHGNYKLLHMGPVGDANAGSRETYVLVQKGTPAPELTGNLADAHVVPIPIQSVYENSGGGSLVTALEFLGEAESLIGLGYIPFGDFSDITPEVDQRYKADDFLVANTWNDGWETVVEADPDVVVVPFSADERATARTLGLPAVFYNSYWETPLGAAEHLKFWALFYNKERLANELFAPVEINYVALAAQVQAAVSAESPPQVLHGNINRRGSWSTFGPDRVDYHLIRDAGGTPVLIDENLAQDAFASLSVEDVIEVGAGAQFWWNSSYNALDNGGDGSAWVAQEPLNGEIPALQNGAAFHIFKRGEDYYKTAVNYRADLLLRDLVSILHPELAPDHETIWLELITPP